MHDGQDGASDHAVGRAGAQKRRRRGIGVDEPSLAVNQDGVDFNCSQVTSGGNLTIHGSGNSGVEPGGAFGVYLNNAVLTTDGLGTVSVTGES